MKCWNLMSPIKEIINTCQKIQKETDPQSCTLTWIEQSLILFILLGYNFCFINSINATESVIHVVTVTKCVQFITLWTVGTKTWCTFQSWLLKKPQEVFKYHLFLEQNTNCSLESPGTDWKCGWKQTLQPQKVHSPAHQTPGNHRFHFLTFPSWCWKVHRGCLAKTRGEKEQ